MVWTIVFALASSTAFAASPEDDYIAARDKAIAAIAALNNANTAIETIDAQNEKALADLQQRLSGIIGPLAVKDFPATGTINIESLSDSDIGYGMLDGLRYTKGDDGPTLVATTRGLLERWLQAKAAETDESFKLPDSIDAALKLDAFYTQAINSDAAFEGTLDFPLKTPQGADIAFARLGGWTQDVGPIYEQEVIVTLVKGKSVMITAAPAACRRRSPPATPSGRLRMPARRNSRRPTRLRTSRTKKRSIPPTPPGTRATATIAPAWASICRETRPSRRCSPRRRRWPIRWRESKAPGRASRQDQSAFSRLRM